DTPSPRERPMSARRPFGHPAPSIVGWTAAFVLLFGTGHLLAVAPPTKQAPSRHSMGVSTVSLGSFSFRTELPQPVTVTLTVNARGELLNKEGKPLRSEKAIKHYLRGQALLASRRARAGRSTKVLLRANPEAPYRGVVQVVRLVGA